MTIPSLGGPAPREGFLTSPEWSDTTRSALESMIVEHAGAVAALDFDDTIVDGDISVALLEDQADRLGRDLVAEYEADVEAAGKHDAYARLVETLLVGHTETEIRRQTEHAIERRLVSGALRYRPAIAELIWALHRHQWQVWVVTASPAVVIAPAARRVGIGADRVLGMWCGTDSDGRFVGPTRDPITFRSGKVEALESATGSTAPIFAAGDAVTDLEMLCQARYALVVDRGVAVLRQEAERRAWWIEGGL